MEILAGMFALLLAVGAFQIAGEGGRILRLGPTPLRWIAAFAAALAFRWLLATGGWAEAIFAWWICLSAAATLAAVLRPLAPRALEAALIAMPALLLAAEAFG